MAKFTFRMATLLRLREAARDQRRAELAQAYRADELLQEQQQHAAREFEGLRDLQRRTAGPGRVNVDWLIESQRYELALRAQQRQLQRQRDALAGEIERRRLALVEANREVRSLELLRERQLEAHRHEESRRDIKRLDEIAQQRAIRAEAW
jgi:flagellar export protein FliJ